MGARTVYRDATKEEINEVMKKSQEALLQYKKFSLRQRADFMHTVAEELEEIRPVVVPAAMEESHLPEGRLNGELSRTIYQLNSYAQRVEDGAWMGVRIDTAIPERKPLPRPDLRKMMIPLGPVVVFGSSNFPFAFSTAGGDTACAFAAGCSVIVKAHPGHPHTSELVAGAILKGVQRSNMPDGVFAHVFGESFEVGKELVLHPLTKAVSFTGSWAGGRALFDLANQRPEPIPVFAEMGSINPVFLMPDKLKQEAQAIAKMYAGSITQGVGQFCTNPGLIIGMEGDSLNTFISLLSEEIKKTEPGDMLHPGIARAYLQKRKEALEQKGVYTEAVSETKGEDMQGEATLASVSAATFLSNPVLHREVFGPYSLIIKCKDIEEMKQVALHIEGQLTSTLMASDTDMQKHAEIIENIIQICGRILMNGVPTGVEVCLSMQHGGPYPATTDSRFTSVGADGISRFVRPVCYQNFPDQLLPEELRDENPLGIWRTVNNVLTRERVE